MIRNTYRRAVRCFLLTEGDKEANVVLLACYNDLVAD